MNQEHYKNLSLPPLPNNKNKKRFEQEKQPQHNQIDYESQLRTYIALLDNNELQQKLKSTFDQLIMSWSLKHDALIDKLISLEQSKTSLERKFSSQSIQCKKAQRDASIYKTRYEHYILQRKSSNSGSSGTQPQTVDYHRRKTSLAPSNTSYTTNSSSSIRSSSSSTHTYFSHLTDTIDSATVVSSVAASTICYEDQDEETDDSRSVDFFSVVSDQTSHALPLESPPPTPNSTAAAPTLMPPYRKQHRETGIIENERPDSIISSPSGFLFDSSTCNPSDDGALKFGCGDGFWNAIAQSKTNKREIEELISKYLQRGGNPNVAKNSETVKSVKEGYGLIHAVVAVKNTAALQRILDAGAKTNVYPLTKKLQDKIHPLIIAAKLGYMTGVRLLIERGGAHVLKNKGPMGESALHAAIQSDSDEMVEYLIRVSKTLLLEATDDAGATPLHYACISGRTRLVEVFIKDHQVQPDPQDLKGETPLHYAVRHRKNKVVMKLVGELGVFPSPYVHKQVPTPFDLAKSGGLKSIAEYLRQMGGKTTKEMDKASKTASTQSNSSTISGGSGSSHESQSGPSTGALGVRHYLHTKTSQILRGSF